MFSQKNIITPLLENTSGPYEYKGGVLFLHRVLIQNYSRSALLLTNNSEVPLNALSEKCKPCVKLTSYDLQTFRKLAAPPAGMRILVDRVLC